jgi:PAS domain S-box-containing protein
MKGYLMIGTELFNIIPLVVIILTTITSICFLWGQPVTSGFKVVIFLLLITAGWAHCYLFELMSNTESQQVFWNKAELLLNTAIPILMLLLGLHYSKKYLKLSWGRLILIIIPPVLSLLLFWSPMGGNDLWNQRTLIHLGGWFPLILRSMNFPFLIYVGLTYFYLFLGAFLLAKTYFQSPNLFRKQAVLVFVAIFFLFTGDICSNLFLNLFPRINLMLYVVMIAVIMAMPGLFGHYLPIVPIARTTVVNSMNDAVIVLDDHFRVVDLNLAGEKLLGLTIEEAAGQLAPDYIPLELDLDKKGSNLKEREIMIDKGGQEYYYHVQITPLFKKRPHPFGHLVVIRDLTEKKRIELLQRKIEDEIVKNQKLESLGLLAGGIAHDFNNILNIVWGNFTIAKTLTEPGSDIYKRLNMADKAFEKARELTQQLVVLSKGGTPIKKNVSLTGLISESIHIALSNSEVRCEFIPDLDLWMVEADEGQLSQVFNNLLINAKQAMKNSGFILIKAENVIITEEDDDLPLAMGKYVKISLKDNGVGIPEKDLRKIFEPYFSTKPGSSGLGLTTVYYIVKKHNGHIQVESQPGHGASFLLFLPAAKKMFSV